jgi:hypothetical protein
LQKDKDHYRNENQRLDESLLDLVDRGLDCGRRIVDNLVIQIGREYALGVLHSLVNRLGSLELVRSGQEIDRHCAGRLAV